MPVKVVSAPLSGGDVEEVDKQIESPWRGVPHTNSMYPITAPFTATVFNTRQKIQNDAMSKGLNVRAVVTKAIWGPEARKNPENWGVITRWTGNIISNTDKLLCCRWAGAVGETQHSADELIVIHHPIPYPDLEKKVGTV